MVAVPHVSLEQDAWCMSDKKYISFLILYYENLGFNPGMYTGCIIIYDGVHLNVVSGRIDGEVNPGNSYGLPNIIYMYI